jgi:large subunit ribosomal protein L4
VTVKAQTIDVIAPDGSTSGKADLPGEVFDVQVNIPLIHQVVVAQLAAARQGSHSSKTRAEVAGGGTVHGPTPRGYEQRTPKKMKAAALRGALSDRATNGRVHVVTAIVDGDTPSTKAAAATLANLTERANVLVVLERGNDTAWLSLRNLTNVHIVTSDQLNTYDVLVSDDVVFTEAALSALLEGPVRGKSAKATASSAELEASDSDEEVSA